MMSGPHREGWRRGSTAHAERARGEREGGGWAAREERAGPPARLG